MAGIGPSDLYDLQVELLDAAVLVLGTDAPTRAFVTVANPVLEIGEGDCGCDQLIVHATNITEAATVPFSLGIGTRPRQDFRINLPGLTVTISRCVPTLDNNGNPPAPADSQAAAEQLSGDIWTLYNELWNMVRAGELFELCKEVYFDGAVPIPASGGCAGWRLNLRVQLEGYE
jgi:hypothetical protein